MWKAALAIAVWLQVGVGHADPKEPDDRDVHVDCPSQSDDAECAKDEAVSPALPDTSSTAPAAPAAMATAAPERMAYATVSFRNDVGKKLRLVEARFTMDGENLPTVLTDVEPGRSYGIVSGAVKPGPHIVTVRLTYRGDRGVFSYMNGYKLNVKSDQVLTAPAERSVSFTVVGSENKGMTVPMEKRVMVRVETSSRR